MGLRSQDDCDSFLPAELPLLRVYETLVDPAHVQFLGQLWDDLVPPSPDNPVSVTFPTGLLG